MIHARLSTIVEGALPIYMPCLFGDPLVENKEKKYIQRFVWAIYIQLDFAHSGNALTNRLILLIDRMETRPITLLPSLSFGS